MKAIGLRAWGALGDPLVVAIVVFVALRLYAGWGIGPVSSSDTPNYFELDFLGGATRLWTVPLVYEVLGSKSLIVTVQVALGAAAWAFLALQVRRSLDSATVGMVAALAVLALGLAVQVTEADPQVLSESLSMSLFVVLAGLALAARGRRSPRSLAVLIGVLTLWIFARHANALLFLVLVLPAIVVLWVRASRRTAAIFTLILALLAVWSAFDVSRDRGITRYNAIGLIEARYANDEEALRFFRERGMPQGAMMRSPDAIPSSPLRRRPDFQAWIEDRWRGAYIAFLLQRPRTAVEGPFRAAPELLSANTSLSKPRLVLPEPIQGLLWARTPGDLPFLFGVAAAAGLLALARARAFGRLLLPWALVAAGLLWLLMTWNLAATELTRLTVPVSLMVRLGLVLAIAVAVDLLAAGPSRLSAAASAARRPA